MAKLVWDQQGQREIESGVSSVALFPIVNGAYTTGVAWNGVTAISENPGGADLTDLFADDQKYASLRAAETFGFTIEAFTYPDEWNACDGNVEANDAPGVFVGQQSRQAFGLAYITKIGDDTHPGMDKGEKLHLVYNCTASPSGRSYTTINDNPDAITFSWEASSTPVNCAALGTGKKTSLIVIDSTKANAAKYSAFKDIVFGGTNSSATLPDPDSVIGDMTPST